MTDTPSPSESVSSRSEKSRIEKLDVEAVNSKESRSLYAARKKIFPKAAKGPFRTLKWWITAITLGIYYLGPWLRWDRGAGSPDQAILVDMANRRFYFFFIEIWPHEFFYVAGLLVMAGIGLFLVTSTLGRAWCGYTCPQTVWVDLFIEVERLVQGDRNARMKLDAAPWNFSKIRKLATTHIIWLLIAISTGGAWIFYFADAPTLLRDLFSGTAVPEAYITVGILTATTYIFGGFMREQVCTYMCPWPRIQAAMLDEDSLMVTYNAWRGEPRSRKSKLLRREGKPVGDCVDCNACVAVCPMGIDIRDGQQMECITCALCIDACDNVMSKLGLEKGLIAYSTLEDYTANMQMAGVKGSTGEITSDRVYEQIQPSLIRNSSGKLIKGIKCMTWQSIMRPRTYIYMLIYGGIGLALLTVLALRPTLDVKVLHDRNPLFVKLSDGSIRNGFELKILNMRGQARQFLIEMEGLDGAVIKQAGSQAVPSSFLKVDVVADKVRAVRLYVTMKIDALQSSRTPFTFKVTPIGELDSTRQSANFEAPAEVSR